jgi:hypothetical protein
LNDLSICPKTNTNQQQSKSEAKAIPREAKVQKWWGESRPGEGLLNLKGVVVSAWTIWFFRASESARSWEWKYPKIVKMWAKSIKNEARGTPWGGARRSRRRPAGREPKKPIFLTPTGSPLEPFRCH